MKMIPEFINASAGTGKTTRLVVYFLYKLLQSKDPKKVIACTFTIAATNEFKSRVVEYLRKKDQDLLSMFEDFDLPFIDIPEDKEKFIPILEIKTLDSFFLSLFSKNSNNIFYRVMSDFDSERIYQESYQEWIKSSEGFEDRKWRKRLEFVVKNLEPYDIEESKSLFESCKLNDKKSFFLKRKKEIQDLFLVIKSSLPLKFKPTAGSGDFVRLLEEAYLALDFSNLDTKDVINQFNKIEKYMGLRKSLDVDLMQKITKFKALLKNYQKYEFQDFSDGVLFEKVLSLILIFKLKIKKERFFSSAFVLRDLLKNLKEGNFDFECEHLFIDEFQDTNRFQGEILRNLKENFNFDVTFVGDSKQAIYKFRDASSAAFFKVEKRVKKEKKKVLNKSFRSNRPILALTNWLFEKFYGDSKEWCLFSTQKSNAFSDSEKYPLTIWSCISPEKENPNREPWKKKGKSDSVSLEERAIECISWIRENHPKESILVLGKSWQKLEKISKRLSSTGINTVIAGSPRLMKDDDIDQDVSHLKQIIRCFINPKDKSFLTSVLMGNSFAHDLKDIKIEKNIKKSLEIIKKYSSRLYEGDSVTSLIVDFLNETGYIYGIKGDIRSHERTLKIFEFLRNVAQYEKEGFFKSVDDFIYWADSEFRNHSPPPGLENPEPVVLRTCYGAKGLSADHVVIINPDEPPQKICFEDSRIEDIFPKPPSRSSNCFELKLKDGGDLDSMWFLLDEGKDSKKVWTNESFINSWKKTSEEFYQEQINVNYVSMTRAKKTLHVVSNGFYHPQKLRKGDFFSEIYKTILDRLNCSFEAFSTSPLSDIDIPIPNEYLKEQDYSEKSFIKYLFPCSRKIKHRERNIDKNLLNDIREESFSKTRAEDLETSDASDSEEIVRGNCFHKIIEIFGPPFNDDSWIKDVSSSKVDEIMELSSTELKDSLFSFVKKINKDKSWISIKKDLVGFWTEYQIKGYEQKEFQKIDLILEKKDCFVIIDWKTGKRNQSKKEKYSNQILNYKDIFSDFLNKNKINKNIECFIVWIDEDEKMMERIN